MTRVIIHAGFHKTGTTSLQNFMKANEKNFPPTISYYGKTDFLGAGAAARIYGQRPFPWRLWRFKKQLRGFLEGIKETKTIILSRETFAGTMPGHSYISGRVAMNYSPASVKLAKVIIRELHRRFGSDVEIEFLYTTRARDAWLRSVHGHLLRSIKLELDQETFVHRMSETESPDQQAKRIAKAISPTPVHISALEDTKTAPFGPAQKLVELLEIDPETLAKLSPVAPAYQGQSADLRAAFLALNREVKNKTVLRKRKEALLRQGHKPE